MKYFSIHLQSALDSIFYFVVFATVLVTLSYCSTSAVYAAQSINIFNTFKCNPIADTPGYTNGRVCCWDDDKGGTSKAQTTCFECYTPRNSNKEKCTNVYTFPMSTQTPDIDITSKGELSQGPSDKGSSTTDTNSRIGMGGILQDQVIQSNDAKIQKGVTDQTANDTKTTVEKMLVPSIVGYDVNVKLNSITVYNNHEAFGRGTGEFHLIAFIHGLAFDLTGATGFGVCGYGFPSGGNPLHCGGLWDASEDITIPFRSGSSMTVRLPIGVPLTIFTLGEEVDGCSSGLHKYLPDLRKFGPGWYLTAFTDPQYNWQNVKQDISDFQKEIGKPATCDWADDNDALGTVNEVYDAPNFNAGPIEVRSSNGDFSLLYTLTVTPLQDNK